MTNTPKTLTLSPADRKKSLIEEGKVYRTKIKQARHDLHGSLSAGMIAQNAVDHVTTAAFGAFNSVFSVEGLKNGGWQKLVPIVLSGVTALSRRRGMLKPVLKGGAVLAGLATVAVLVFRNKKVPKLVKHEVIVRH